MVHRMLRVDLSNRSYDFEEISEETIHKFVGGRGLGSYLLYHSMPARVDPLGKENHLIYTAGLAGGTNFPFSSKVNIITKSPQTGIYLYTTSSGSLGHQMKKAGIWAIDIQGAAEYPTYIVINDQGVQFRDAAALWGMEPAKTQEMMLGGMSPKKAATAAIGPAGEQQVLYASVFSEGPLYRSFSRGGAGAVMGAKKLKGLVVSGDGVVEIGDQGKYQAVKQELDRLMKTQFSKWAKRWSRYETDADLEIMNHEGMIPTRNWQTGQFDGWRGVDKSTTPMGWPEKGYACGPYCPIAGCREVKVTDGPYQGYHSDIEWEAVYAFGCSTGVDKMEAVIAASQICDEYGIDTITAGVTIGFAMECFEKGLLGEKDTDGIDLRFGNDKAMIAALQKIVKQEGFGRELAKGVKRLSEQIKGSADFAMHVKGMELGGYECRGLNGQAIAFAINNRGGCHHGYGLPARREMFDDTRMATEGKGDYVKDIAAEIMLRDSIPICYFILPFNSNWNLLADLLASLSGKQWTAAAAKEAGYRIMCQERLFNMREGVTRKDDSLPARLLKEPKPDGPTRGVTVPLDTLLDDFYRSMGYDLATGNPTDELLAKLGIEK